MAELTAKMEGIKNVRGNIKKLIDRNPTLAAKVMRTSAMHVIVPAIRAKIKQNQSVFTGEWHSRQNAKVTKTTKGLVEIEIGAFGVPYGLNIEKGAPPHTPNEGRIREYVRKKMGLSGGDAESMVFAIASTIAAQGSKKKPAIMPAWNANSARFYADFVKRMRLALLATLGTGGGKP